ncbi:MAG: PKD domain-containing protein [Candidatus Margulisiibacteriota bacterium]|jgi:hypothetical protein
MDIYNGLNLVGKYENGMCIPADSTSSSPAKNIKPEADPRGSLPLPNNIMPRRPLTLADFNPLGMFIGCVNPAGSSACQSIGDGIGSFSMNIPNGVNQYSIPVGTPIEFKVAIANAECVDPSKISVRLETGNGNFDLAYANGVFSTTQNADKAWGKPIKLVVRDGDNKIVTSQSFNDFAISTDSTGASGNYQAGINVGYEDSGHYARRAITLSPNWSSEIPAGTLNYSWEVKDPDGNPVNLTIGGNNAAFTPMRDGTFTATLTITGEKLEKPLTVQKSDIIVYPFPAPGLKIDGNLYPKGLSEQSYLPVLIPSDYRPELGPEDEAAICSFKLYHFFNGAPVEDGAADQSCRTGGQPNPFSFTFPEVATNTNYYLEVKAVGGDNSYEIAKTETISVAPSGSMTVTGDFTVATPYSERLAHRPITLNALIIDGAAAYRWEVVAKDNVPYSTPLLIGEGLAPTVSHTFDEAGKYAIKLTVLDANQEVLATVTKEGAEALEIYPFPAPAVAVSWVNNNGLFVNKPIAISALILRDWPEDLAATLEWRISHTELQGGQPTQVDDFVYSGVKNIEPVFAVSRSYRVDLKVVSNAYSVDYTAPVPLEIYTPYAGTPQVLINGSLEYSYSQGETATNISGWTDSTNPDAKYRWTITKPDLTQQIVDAKDIPSFNFAQTGEYAFKLEVLDGSDNLIGSASRLVNIYPVAGAIPQATISGNLEYSLHQGDVVSNITGYSSDNDPNNQYEWSVVAPDPNDPSGFVTIPYSGQTIASFDFPNTGEYLFTFTVKDSQGNIKTTASRKVNVYDKAVAIPPAGIVGPTSGKVNEGIPLSAAVIDGALYTYTWDFGNGTFGSGPIPTPPVYANEGAYPVKLVMARIDDPTVKTEANWMITIVKQTVTPPAVQILFPPAAEEDTPVPMSLTVADPLNWEITWDFADGKPFGSGTDVSHQFDNGGIKQMVVKLKSTIDGMEYYFYPQIYIATHGSPVPNLVITPGQGPSPLAVVADAGLSYPTGSGASLVKYTFYWGDSPSAIESGSAASLPHTFACAATDACKYTVRVVVEDSNGKTSELTSLVTVWPQ